MKAKKINHSQPIAAEQTQELPTYHFNNLLLIISPLLLIFLGILFYKPSLTYPFQFDDLANITKFFNIRHITFKDAFFVHARWIANWFNAINYRMGNFEPFWYRSFNVGFHIITSIITFLFVYTGLNRVKHNFFKTNAFFISLCTAILFLLHPVQTQTVSYIIQGRLEGLAGLLIMLLGLCFLLYNQATDRISRGVLCTLLFIIAAFACGTKEIAIVAPALILLTDWFFVAQGNIQELKKRWWIHATLFVIVGCLYVYYLKPGFFINLFGLKMEYHNNIGNTITENRTDKILPFHYFISEFKVILHYLGIFLWPFNISVDYDWMMVKHFFAPDCFFPFCALIAIFSFLYALFKRNQTNLIVFGMLWFFISIAPRATLMPSTELLADYKTYLGSFGWLFVLATGLVYLLNMLFSRINSVQSHIHHPVAQMTVLLFLALPIGFGTYQRNKVWRSAVEFWANILSNAPNRARVHNNYGVALSEQGKYQESIPYYLRATRMDHLYPDPWNNLAVAYSVLGKIDDAIEALKQSLRINPYYPEAYNNLASFLIEKKDYEGAEKMLHIALQLRPHYGKAFYNWGRLWLSRAQATTDEKQKNECIEKGWQLYKDACTKADFDNNIMGLNEFANLSMKLQKFDDAIFALERMLALNPSLHEAVFLIGNLNFFKKDYESARIYYEEMTRRVPEDIRAWNNLGEMYYALKNYQAATTCLETVVKINPSMVNPQLRLAECLEKIGRINEAKQILVSALDKPEVPAETKNTIRTVLAKANALPGAA